MGAFFPENGFSRGKRMRETGFCACQRGVFCCPDKLSRLPENAVNRLSVSLLALPDWRTVRNSAACFFPASGTQAERNLSLRHVFSAGPCRSLLPQDALCRLFRKILSPAPDTVFQNSCFRILPDNSGSAFACLLAVFFSVRREGPCIAPEPSRLWPVFSAVTAHDLSGCYGSGSRQGTNPLFTPDTFRRLRQQTVTGMPVLPERVAGLLLRIRGGRPVFGTMVSVFRMRLFPARAGFFAVLLKIRVRTPGSPAGFFPVPGKA